jgi:membrane protease YdiL (CAAX protease family)
LAAVVVLALRIPGLLGYTELRTALNSRPLVASMIVGAIVYSLAVLATYVVIVRRSRGSWRDIGFRSPPLLILLLTPVLFIGQMMALIITNVVIVSLVGEFENPQVAALTDPSGFSWLNFGLVFFVGAILAPIVEELLFRGLLYQWLRGRAGVAAAVLLSAALFAVVHFIPLLIPALFAVGIILALVFEWTKSLWITITLHFFQNALGISVIFLLQAFPELVPQV